jgi:hypothetical protein
VRKGGRWRDGEMGRWEDGKMKERMSVRSVHLPLSRLDLLVHWDKGNA